MQENTTKSMKLTRTDQQAIWSLTVPDQAPYPFVDTLADTALLRHRPDAVSPISWFKSGQTSWTFSVSQRTRLPLSEAVDSIARDPETGFKILNAIMEAVEVACDCLLPIIPALLHQDLIWIERHGAGHADFSVQIVTLPIVYGEREEVQQEPELIDWMGEIFQWDTLVTTQLAMLFHNRLYCDLLLEAKVLCGESRLPAQDAEKRHRYRPQRVHSASYPAAMDESVSSNGTRQSATGDPLGKRIASRLKKLGHTLFGFHDQEMIHEVTKELDLSSDQFRIAQLSEGLPGTPDEELGHHAYLLNDEFVVGRDMSKADFWIDSFSISRRHAVIRRRAGSYFIEDLGSKNGTILDGVRLTKHREHLLPEKCKISFADHVYYFRSA